jgi:predicted glycosyltransferase
VLVTAGGGGDGYNLMKNYLKSLKLQSQAVNGDPERAIHSVLVLGPEMPAYKKERLLAKTTAAPGTVKFIDFSTEILSYMNAADLVVSMGGYNTVCEILSLEKRAIIIPRVRPVTEQMIRAQRMHDLGLIDVIHPEKLTPTLLSKKILELLFEAGEAHDNAWKVLDTEGLPRISRFVAEEVRARTAS